MISPFYLCTSATIFLSLSFQLAISFSFSFPTMEIEGSCAVGHRQCFVKKSFLMGYIEIFKEASDWVLVLSFNKDILEARHL